MKNKFIILLVCLFTAQFLLKPAAFGQIKEIGAMLSGSKDDAQKLMEAYLKPYTNAFGADLNSAWYNTAKPHKLLGFDLTASISAAFVPSADKTYDLKSLGLSTNPTFTNGTIAPTIAGSKTDVRPSLEYKAGTVTYAKFQTPNGTGWSIIPAPMFQLGLGLIKETDVTVRLVPTMKLGDFGSVGLWGVGLKHSLKQWIPGIKMAPFFNLSAFLGYTKMTVDGNISFPPEFYVSNINAIDQTTLPYDNQKTQMVIKGFTGNIVASFDIPVITFYGAVGFATTSTSLKLTGDYPIAKIDPSVSLTQAVVKDSYKLVDPINMKMSSSSGSTTKPRLNLGIKFKMAIIHIHFDYTYANYSVVSAGLGISFR